MSLSWCLFLKNCNNFELFVVIIQQNTPQLGIYDKMYTLLMFKFLLFNISITL